jgi:hypothetical protein
MKPLKPKEWTPNQIKRLPQEGYWLNVFKFTNGEVWYTANCIKNGHIQYIRTDHLKAGHGWGTLLWTCMTTRKQMATLPKNVIGDYYHFQTIKDMQAAFPDLPVEFYQKPVNDF